MAAKRTRGQLLGAGASALRSTLASSAAASAEFEDGPFDASFGLVDGYFLFELEDSTSGWLNAVEGGATTGDIVTEKLGPDQVYAKKHLGNVKYNEFSVQFRVGSNRPLMDWVKASWNSSETDRRSGAFVAADFDYKVQHVEEFEQALITAVSFPSLDSSAKDPAYMTVKFAPELTRYKKGSGKVENPVDVKQKVTWFMGVDGLDGKAVSKIDAFTVKQSAVVAGEPAKVEYPNLSLWLDPDRSASWFEWFDDFVIAGNNDDAKQKNGSLIMLDPTRQKALLELTFSGLGIFKLSPEKLEAGSETIKRIKAELYVEQIDFKLPT